MAPAGEGAAPRYPTVLAAAFVVAEVADVVTALVVSHELNPLIGAGPPVVSIVLKVALICFVLAVVRVIGPRRPVLARLVLIVGILAGVVGTISNTDLTPFRP